MGHAAARAEVRGARDGLAALGDIAEESVESYQPYWALRAHLHGRLGEDERARQAYARAIGLSEEAAVREFLVARAATSRRPP